MLQSGHPAAYEREAEPNSVLCCWGLQITFGATMLLIIRAMCGALRYMECSLPIAVMQSLVRNGRGLNILEKGLRSGMLMSGCHGCKLQVFMCASATWRALACLTLGRLSQRNGRHLEIAQPVSSRQCGEL